MYLLLVILMLIASVLMCFIVLIQNSKGGGLASGFSSSNQIMGVRKTTDFLEKATWTLAAVMVVFSIVSAYTIPSSTGKGGAMDGMDALLATVQMPSGIPVATVALNGAKNAAWLAAEILALSDDALAEKLAAERTAMAAQIAAKEEKLQAEIAQL
jgi:preprotein translocase subunit SecG